MKKSSLLCSVALLTALLISGRPAAAQAPAKSELKLEHRSAFAAPKSAAKGNPFWPIGWVPTAETLNATGPVNVPTVNSNSFVLSSVLMGADPMLAIINGREYAIGDQVPVGSAPEQKPSASAAFKAQVVAIRDGEAVLRYSGRDIVVALKIR